MNLDSDAVGAGPEGIYRDCISRPRVFIAGGAACILVVACVGWEVRGADDFGSIKVDCCCIIVLQAEGEAQELGGIRNSRGGAKVGGGVFTAAAGAEGKGGA